jgi:hypothetical protein
LILHFCIFFNAKVGVLNVQRCNKLKNIECDKIVTLNYVVSKSKEEYIDFYHCICDTLSTTNKEWITSDKSRFNNQPYKVIKSKVISLDKLIDIYMEHQI